MSYSLIWDSAPSSQNMEIISDSVKDRYLIKDSMGNKRAIEVGKYK
jgi:hypothetical protein